MTICFVILHIKYVYPMKIPLRSNISTQGRRMAGARALWRANGMDDSQFGKPVIAVVNSFTQFVPGHVHLGEAGQIVKKAIEEAGCFAAEFNTIAVDDGIAMGHNGMLYSLPSRDLIADSVEYMVNAHCADAMVCISNCDKVTPGMLLAAMRLNIPAIFVSGGPMEAGEVDGEAVDLVDVMVRSADQSVSDETVAKLERQACPTCGSCSGMFTANSMNCLTEALGLSLPGNGTVPATHTNRRKMLEKAGRRIVEMAYQYYNEGNANVLPRNIANRQAMLNAMTMDIAMGGSTNTVLHLLAVAAEAGTDFKMEDIDTLSRHTPVLCKVAPNSRYHIDDVNHAGGVLTILKQLADAGLVDTSLFRADGHTLSEAMDLYAVGGKHFCEEADLLWRSAPGRKRTTRLGCQDSYYPSVDTDRTDGCIRDVKHAYMTDGGLAVLHGNLAPDGCVVKTAGVDAALLTFRGPARVFQSQEDAMHGILDGTVKEGDAVLITYEGPAGGPGMQEMLYPTSYLKSRHIDRRCALITDGRFSGGTSGLSIGHVSPEAAAGGAIGLVRNGDIIEIDIPHRRISVMLSDDELEARREEELTYGHDAFTPRNRKRVVSNALRIYSKFVSSADKGGIRKLN